MTATLVSLETEILAQLQQLDPQRQQQALDFIEFLLSRQQASIAPESETTNEETEAIAPAPTISALEAAGDLVGCLEGSSDLSMRKKLFKQSAQRPADFANTATPIAP